MQQLKVVFAAPDGVGTAKLDLPVDVVPTGGSLMFKSPADGGILLIVSENSFYYAANITEVDE